MVEMRDLIDKVGGQTLNEAYITGWGITDSHGIHEHIIESLIEWYEDNGWDQGIFIDLLASYMSAIGARANESPGMQSLMKRAMRLILQEYKEMATDGSLINWDWDEHFQSGIDRLRQLGMDWPEFAKLEKSMHAFRREEDAKYDRDDEQDGDEGEENV